MSAQPGIRFFYLFCDDLQAMRTFYTHILGLNEIYFAKEPDGAVAYDCDGLQFTIFVDRSKKLIHKGWAQQPGWEGGTQTQMSWSVVLTKEGFKAAVEKLKVAKVELFYIQPQWKNYWSFPVKDPMGNTVEIVFDSGDKIDWTK